MKYVKSEYEINALIGLAKELAHRSPNRLKHAALVLDKKWRVLSYGVNHGYVHAEVDAIRKLPIYKRKNTILISVRLSQGGHYVATAKPCPACRKILLRYNVKKVFYTTRNRTLIESKVRDLEYDEARSITRVALA